MAKDRVAALNQSLARSVTSDEDKVEIDNIPMNCDGDINKIAEATEEAKEEAKEETNEVAEEAKETQDE